MPTFNEPEVCLLREWTNARLLEDSMESAREKYTAIFEKILDEAQKNHPLLDRRQSLLSKRDGRAGIGKKTWPSKSDNWYISGFWIGNILLDELTSEDEDHPHSFIWVNHPDSSVDLNEAQSRLAAAAKSILTKEEQIRCSNSDRTKGISWIWWPLQLSRQDLLDLLVKGNGREFIACMVAQFDTMARFTSVMDEIYQVSKRIKK